MVHFSVIRVKGSPSYDFDACGDILAMAKAVVPEKLRTLDRGRPWRDSQFASTRLSPSRDMSR